MLRTQEFGDIAVELDGRDCPGPELPRGWEQARRLTVRLGRRELLGSPIDIAAIRRCVGFVQMEAGALRGWAWHPGDPDATPTLLIRQAKGPGTLRVTAEQPVDDLSWTGALARPRGFIVPAAALAELPGLLHVAGTDGRDLSGSPLDPGGERLATAAAARVLARLYPATQVPGVPEAARPCPCGRRGPRPAWRGPNHR